MTPDSSIHNGLLIKFFTLGDLSLQPALRPAHVAFFLPVYLLIFPLFTFSIMATTEIIELNTRGDWNDIIVKTKRK